MIDIQNAVRQTIAISIQISRFEGFEARGCCVSYVTAHRHRTMVCWTGSVYTDLSNCLSGGLTLATYLNPTEAHESERDLSFETLLAEISSRFVNIPAQQVDHEIEESLRQICRSLDVDESTIYLRDGDDPDSYVLTYVLRDPDLPPPPKMKFTASENFPWCNSRLVANEVICLPDIEAAPDEAAVDKAMWRKFGIYSALVIPLITGGRRPKGFWGIDSTTTKRDWPEFHQKRLKLIAEVFANALEEPNPTVDWKSMNSA